MAPSRSLFSGANRATGVGAFTSTLALALGVLLFAGAATAQSANATDTINAVNQAYLVVTYPNSQGVAYPILPLTARAFEILPHGEKDTGSLNGSVVLGTPGSSRTVAQPMGDNIAYISCDAADFTDGNATDTVHNAISGNPLAIVFYSRSLNFCNLTDPSAYGYYQALYTMNNTATATQDLLRSLLSTNLANDAELFSEIAFENWLPTVSGSGGTSTAVAMIILYAITGIITALFLVIIITGAIRAHRHPERYGPRNVLGRPRQSRAKGLARAMLDTIPIVKFGENRDQPPPKDVESVAGPSTGTEMDQRNGTETGQSSDTDAAAATAQTPGVVAAKDTTSPTDSPADVIDDSALQPALPKPAEEETQGCSICTDDFERGQDIRVLPCGHQFHPACVDPWLLDVSGTCPLCRVDLNPQEGGAEGDALPPPLDAAAPGTTSRRAAIRHYFMGALNPHHGIGQSSSAGTTGLLAPGTPAQRLEALRRWRNAQRQQAATAAATAATTPATASTAAEPQSTTSTTPSASASGTPTDTAARRASRRLSMLVPLRRQR